MWAVCTLDAGGELEQCQVVSGIHSEKGGLQTAHGSGHDLDLPVRILDHMRRGQHNPIRIDDASATSQSAVDKDLDRRLAKLVVEAVILLSIGTRCSCMQQQAYHYQERS